MAPLRKTSVAVLFLLLGSALVVLNMAGQAYGDDCAALGGALVGGECQITTARAASDSAHGGPFTIDETLRIKGSGSLIVPAAVGGNSLTLSVAGDVIIEVPTVAGGGRVVGDVFTAGGAGAAITIDAAGGIVLKGNGVLGALVSSNQAASCAGGRGGDIVLSAGATVTSEKGSQITSSSGCRGGEITISGGLSTNIAGLVLSSGFTTLGRGGPITVTAACSLIVSDSGKIQSLGQDPGPDLVHLEGGCEVLIQGNVTSAGPGHIGGDRRCHSPNRADKPANAPACVEVWSGGPLTIDSSSTHNGEISADTGQSGGVLCCAWIDLFASGDIKIIGDTLTTAPFSVHANQFLTNAFAGLITVKSKAGNVSVKGRAIQASAVAGGGSAGIVTLEAKGDTTLDDALIYVQGDAWPVGGFGRGGMVEARAFTGGLSWKNVAGGLTPIGDVQPTGTGVPSAQSGTIFLNSCSAIDVTGTVFPLTAGFATTPTLNPGLCPPAEPDAPSLPDYVFLPGCICGGQPDVSVTKSTSTPVITAGSTASYSIVVSAGGTDSSTNVTLTDTLPFGLSWTVGGPDAAACSPASPVAGGTRLTCNFGTVDPSEAKTITLTATTTVANCPAINNTATVTSDVDINPSNNSSGPVKITVNCVDVKVTKSTTTPVINAGANASYTVAVTANGPVSSTNVVLSDPLPAGLNWTVGGPDAAACLPASPVPGGTMLTCSFGIMAQGVTKTITLTAMTTGTSCPAINNTATVSSDADINSSNNMSGPVKITVNCPDVKVAKSTTTPVINAGANASYSVVVTANGPGSSTGVTLTDTLPAGLNWTVGGPDAGACSPGSPVTGGTTLTCSFGTMGAATAKTITLTAATTGANCPAIENTAMVSADADSNSSNNTSGPVKITVNCPDVKVAKGTTTPVISAGANASYIVVVTANGPGSSTGVTLTDTLPAGLNWTVGGPDAGACSPGSPVTGGTTLTCGFGTMAAATSKTITLTAATTGANCPGINNTATVSAGFDTNSSNNSFGPVTIMVNCAPDVSISKSTTTPIINAGGTASYGIIVTAGGTGSSTNVKLTDVLPGPASMGWTVGGADAGACSPNPVAGGSTLTCNFGTMVQGSTKTISLTATTTSANCPSIANTATVSATTDSNVSNNSSGPVTMAVNCADVSVVKSTTTPVISAGGNASYSITVTGNGPGSASNVTLTDTLPSGLTWTVGGADAAACTPASPVAGGTTLSCSFGTLAQGATKTITLMGTTVLTWSFKGPNDAVGTAAGADYASGGRTIHLDAFVNSTSTSNGTAVFVYGKDQGPGEEGAGICVSASGSPLTCNDANTDHEIDATQDGLSTNDHGLIRINLGANVASLSNFAIEIDSVQPGENFKIFTNSINSISGATLLRNGTSADDGVPIPLSGVKQYVFVQGGTAGDVLLHSLTASTCAAINNTATVSATGDTNASNNSSGPVTINVNCPLVSIAKSTTTPTINAGGNASYSITVTTNGPGTSTGVTLTDTLPAGLNWTVGGPDAGACSPGSPVTGGTTLTCSFGAMAAATSKTITLTAATTGANCPGINNTATVSANLDTNPSNNSSGPVTITVNCAPNVSVTKSTTTPTINAGSTASYGITVTAGGTGSSTNVKLTDLLPGPASMNWTVSGAAAASCSPNPVAGGGTLTCNFGTMVQGSTKTITLAATTTTASCPSITNTATVSATTDSNTSNNSSGPVTMTVNCPDVKVTKSTTTPVVSNGGNASYSITVTGNGPGSASNVTLTDTLPRGLNWTVGGPDAGACTPASPVAGGTTLTCSFGTLAQGATKTVTLTGTTVLTWNFKGPNKVIGASAGADYSTGGTTIHLDAFVNSTSTSNGTAVFVYGKDQGAGDEGAGTCVVATGSPLTCQDSGSDHEIDSTSDGLSANNRGLIRLDLGASFASLSNLAIQMDSVQSGANFKILTNSISSISGAILIHSGTSADAGVPIPLANVKRFIFVQAGTAGDALLHSLTADTCGTISNTATVSATGDSNAGNNSSGPVPITISCVCGPGTIFDFSGNSASSGTAGNTRTFTVNGLSVNATAFSRTNSSGAWATAYLGLYGPGLGVTDGSEGSGANPLHKVDNQGGRNNYVLFEFSSPVVIDRAFLDSIGGDSDISVWIGTKIDPFHNHITLSDAVLTSLGARADNDTTSTATSRWADINAGGVSGNVLVIAASASDTTPDDEFKISQLDLKCQ